LMTGAGFDVFVGPVNAGVAVFCASVTGAGGGGKAASGAGVLRTGAGFDVFVEPVNAGVAVFCVSVTGAGGSELFAVCVTIAALVGLFNTGPATELDPFVSFVSFAVVVAVVTVIGAGAFGVALVTGPVAGLITSVEICARRTETAVVSLVMIDAIISVAGFNAGASVGAGVGICVGVCVGAGAAA